MFFEFFYASFEKNGIICFIFVLFNMSFFMFMENTLHPIILSKLFFCLYWIFLFIYFFGLFGVLFNVKNVLISLLFIEVSYIGIVGFLLFLSIFGYFILGFIYALLVILIAAAESVIGLGFVINVFRFQRLITFDVLNTLQV